MKLLEELSFIKAGGWSLNNDDLLHDISSEMGSNKNVLYAFVCDNEICYIGKTTRALLRRIRHYQRPGPTQSTNIRNNKSLKDLLSAGKRVDIYVLIDDKPQLYKGIHSINLAAGLEDSLIDYFKPKWNGTKLRNK